MKEKLKLIVILGVEFAAIAIMLVLIFMAGKQQYTVTFDLNGGTLIGGSLSQSVSQGSNATPPSAVKEGHYLRGWSGSYKGVTHDVTVYAIWEYETTPGIEYKTHKTYSTITGCFKNLTGDVYIGAYHDDMIVLGIGDEAFKDCKRIENIFMLDGILTIGNSAFEACHSLDNVVLPSTTLTLGDRAFANCEKLSSIVLPEDLEEIGAEVFSSCEQLKEIDLPKNLHIIGEGAFENCTSLTSLTLPEGLVEIGDGAFAGCTELTEVYIPKGVQIIGEGAFLGFEKLEKIIFEEDTAEVETPDESATDDNDGDAAAISEDEESAERVTLTIGARAFAGCAALSKILLPERVTSIGDYAFAGCAALTEVVLHESLSTVGTGVFDTPDMIVKLPFAEGDALPEGWSEDFCTAEVTVEYKTEINEGGDADLTE